MFSLFGSVNKSLNHKVSDKFSSKFLDNDDFLNENDSQGIAQYAMDEIFEQLNKNKEKIF